MPARHALVLNLFWLLVVMALADPVPCLAASFYVSPTGSDLNKGSSGAPFRQIRAALTVVHPGDSVLISDGDYLGFTISGIQGLPGQPITLRATGGNANVLPTTDRTDNRDTIFVSFSSYLVLDGLRAFNANRAAIRIDNSPNITVRNGVYGDNATWGIFTDFSDNLLLENNECYGSQTQHGIYISNSCINPTVRHNRLHDNHGSGLHMNGDLSQGGTGLITGASIENNIIYSNGSGGGAGINMDGVQNSTVRNNLLFNNHASGITLFQIDGAAGPQGMQILHNTVDMASDGRWALLVSNTTGPITVRNNILINRNTNHGGLLYNDPTDVGNVDSDYNIQDWISTDGGATRLALADWQAQGHELHSFAATPASLFSNPTGGDYHLLLGAPAIDKGETLAAVVTDLDGHLRPSGIASDIGCYEFAVTVSDFNNDGWNDLLLQNDLSGDVLVWNMQGTSVQSYSYVARATPTKLRIAGVADLNRDGAPDIIWQDAVSGDVGYWLMDHQRHIISTGIIYHGVALEWKIVAVADLNGDGNPDLIFQNQKSGGVIYWRMNGVTWSGVYGWIITSISLDWKVVAAADLNGDGSPDLLWQNQATGDVVYWPMNGVNWTHTWGYIVQHVPLAWKIVAAVDLDRDGKIDLVWLNQTNGDALYWLMNGTVFRQVEGYLARGNAAAWRIVGPH